MIKHKNRTIRVNPLLNKSHPRQSASIGVAALPTILLLGFITIEIIMAVTAVSYIFTESQFGLKSSSDAYLAARAGIQDATMKIIRDKNFTSATTTLVVGSFSADVSVCKDLPCIAVGKHKIISLGKAQTKRRNLEAILNVDAATGKVQLESLRELAL